MSGGAAIGMTNQPTSSPAENTTLPRVQAWMCAALGVSFHILATPRISGVEMRVALADVLMFAMLGLLGWTFFLRKAIPPPAPSRRTCLWLLAILVVLVVSYLSVGIHHDSSAVWARIKIVGFVVLSAYFVLGSWIAALTGLAGARHLARGFVAGAWLSSVIGIVEYAAYFYYDYPIAWLPRPAALSENPNAYGIMLTAALALDLGLGDRMAMFPPRLRRWGRIITIVAIFLSASRSAYVGFFLGVLGLRIFTPFRLRTLGVPLLAAAAVFILLFEVPPLVPGAARGIMSRLAIEGPGGAGGSATAPPKENFAVSREYADHGFRDRLDITWQAFTMWRENPVLGAGLGSFWRQQQSRDVAHPYLNHNTTLWLASELGLVGLAAILGGALLLLWTFVRHSSAVPIAAGVAGTMFVMFGASAGTEVMYQRYTWCFCGLALTLVAAARPRR